MHIATKTRFACVAWLVLSLAFAVSCGGRGARDAPNGGPVIPGDDARDDDATPVDDRTPVECINPFIGTGGLGYNVGSTHPGPHLPHGLVSVGPDTSKGDIILQAYPSDWAMGAAPTE